MEGRRGGEGEGETRGLELNNLSKQTAEHTDHYMETQDNKGKVISNGMTGDTAVQQDMR